MRFAQGSGGIANTGAPRSGGLFDLLKGGDARGRSTAGGLFDLIERNAPLEGGFGGGGLGGGFGGNAPANLTDFSAGSSRAGHVNQEEAFAGLGEWFAYVIVVRNNDKLSNAEKAEQAHAWAHNFEVKGLGFYQLEAEKDAEKYERLAEEDRQREREEELERQRQQERDQELIDATEREQSPDHIPGGAPPA